MARSTSRGVRRLRCLRCFRSQACVRLPDKPKVKQALDRKAMAIEKKSVNAMANGSHALPSAERRSSDGMSMAPTRTGDSPEERIEAREAVKRTLPRYARINNLFPDMTLSYVQRELQKSGFVLWRPSLQEKRASKNPAVGPEPPKEAGGKLFYKDPHVENMLVFCPMGQSKTVHLPLFDSGSLIFQQKASAFPALALNPPRGATVIDSCAAPGSKTSQMAALMQNEGKIFAFDRDERRLKILASLMEHQGATCVEPCQQDFLKSGPCSKRFSEVTHFLLDPSCSSSGMTVSPYSDPFTMGELVRNQCSIIRHAMRFPSCQRIAYSTCSVYEEENELVVDAVLKSKEGASFELVPALPWWPRRGLPIIPNASHCVRSAWEDKTIGFFVAVFQRKQDNPV